MMRKRTISRVYKDDRKCIPPERATACTDMVVVIAVDHHFICVAVIEKLRSLKSEVSISSSPFLLLYVYYV